MKILIIINNQREVSITKWSSGFTIPIKRRSVEIELTQEQEKLLTLNKLCTNGCGDLVTEDIESVSLLLEDKLE